MINITEYFLKNKENIKNENKIFDGFQITGIGQKCLKITNVNNGSDEFISWDEFASENCHFVVNDIRNYYQQKVNEVNEKEINNAVEFIQKDEARIECLKKAIEGDKSFKESTAFDELMDEYLCNFAGASRVAKLAIARLNEDDEDKNDGNEDEVATATPSSSEVETETETPKKIIDKASIINTLSETFGQDVTIITEKPAREGDHQINIEGIDFEIYDTDSCVLFAYPSDPKPFKKVNKFKLTPRCVETLAYVQKHGKEDGTHQYELQKLDENNYIDFDFKKFRYILTDKGLKALEDLKSSETEQETETTYQTLQMIKNKESLKYIYENELLYMEAKGLIKMENNEWKLTNKGLEALFNASNPNKDNLKGKGDNMVKNSIYKKFIKYNTKDGQPNAGDVIYGTTSTLDFNALTGAFESCNAGVTCSVKEIGSDFSDYVPEKCRNGGRYGYYEFKVLEVLD